MVDLSTEQILWQARRSPEIRAIEIVVARFLHLLSLGQFI
jgi:hypothetical protein